MIKETLKDWIEFTNKHGLLEVWFVFSSIFTITLLGYTIYLKIIT